MQQEFLNAIIRLSSNLSSQEVKQLDAILSQSKQPNELLKELFIAFPKLAEMYILELKKEAYHAGT